MRQSSGVRVVLALVCATLLGACAQTSSSGPVLRVEWAAYVSNLQARNYLRTERSAADAPVTPGLIARNFELVVFDAEEFPFGPGTPARPGPRNTGDRIVRKWGGDIRYSILQEDASPADFAQRVRAFAGTLAELTGLDIRPAPDSDDDRRNLVILYATEDELAAIDVVRARETATRATERAAAAHYDTLIAWTQSLSPCAGSLFVARDPLSGAPTGQVVYAVIMIRAGLPDALLQACIEEEFAQIMGPVGDNATVRPSIFNDDQEFARLTDHDRAILQILYDPRIRPGMTSDRAMPIVRRILGQS